VNKILAKAALVLCDFIGVNLAFLGWAWLRQELGLYTETDLIPLLFLSGMVFLFWFFLFMFFGLYGSWYAQSRVDEIITVMKTVTFGVLLIFVLTFDLNRDLSGPPTFSRMLIISYWLILIISASLLRALLRTLQRGLLASGFGRRRTIIVGWDDNSRTLSDMITQYPALGYQLVGFVNDKSDGSTNSSHNNLPLLGNIDNINEIVHQTNVQEVVFALGGKHRKKVMDIMDQCNGMPVNFKIVPDLYDIVMGQARTNQIYGFPLIDIMPQLMPAWERRVKRLLDILISALILILFVPIWLLLALAIKADSKGPVLYRQRRVGKDEQPFTIYKFRSMIHRAESQTGPQWAQKRDPRITRVGRVMRTLHLDEVPQFMNVLMGEMSLVGPRPERAHFVEKFKRQIPFYARRLKVQPGITGWAQVKGDYDTSVENVKTKLQYDLFYLENMSLRMDLKILLNTIYVMLRGKGH
jgi:exopolysaccharide biosynthesis polyprenyl glycosylphosphotransferase